MYREIDSYELIELIKKENIHLIDIRDSYIYSSGTIGNAKNIPLNYLLTNPDDYLEKNKTYYFFCNYGSNSKRLCNFLSRRGYDVVNIVDGYQGYKDSIY